MQLSLLRHACILKHVYLGFSVGAWCIVNGAKRDVKGYFLPASAALRGGGGERGDGWGGERESNASKQVPAPSAPTYRNLFLRPHVMGKDIIYVITHDGRSGHDIKNLFMALSGPLICTLHQSSVHVNQSFLLQYLSRVTVRFPPCMFTYIVNLSVILACKYGAVVLCVAEQSSPERPHARVWDTEKWNTGKWNKINAIWGR